MTASKTIKSKTKKSCKVTKRENSLKNVGKGNTKNSKVSVDSKSKKNEKTKKIVKSLVTKKNTFTSNSKTLPKNLTPNSKKKDGAGSNIKFDIRRSDPLKKEKGLLSSQTTKCGNQSITPKKLLKTKKNQTNSAVIHENHGKTSKVQKNIRKRQKSKLQAKKGKSNVSQSAHKQPEECSWSSGKKKPLKRSNLRKTLSTSSEFEEVESLSDMCRADLRNIKPVTCEVFSGVGINDEPGVSLPLPESCNKNVNIATRRSTRFCSNVSSISSDDSKTTGSSTDSGISNTAGNSRVDSDENETSIIKLNDTCKNGNSKSEAINQIGDKKKFTKTVDSSHDLVTIIHSPSKHQRFLNRNDFNSDHFLNNPILEAERTTDSDKEVEFITQSSQFIKMHNINQPPCFSDRVFSSQYSFNDSGSVSYVKMQKLSRKQCDFLKKINSRFMPETLMSDEIIDITENTISITSPIVISDDDETDSIGIGNTCRSVSDGTTVNLSKLENEIEANNYSNSSPVECFNQLGRIESVCSVGPGSVELLNDDFKPSRVGNSPYNAKQLCASSYVICPSTSDSDENEASFKSGCCSRKSKGLNKRRRVVLSTSPSEVEETEPVTASQSDRAGRVSAEQSSNHPNPSKNYIQKHPIQTLDSLSFANYDGFGDVSKSRESVLDGSGNKKTSILLKCKKFCELKNASNSLQSNNLNTITTLKTTSNKLKYVKKVESADQSSNRAKKKLSLNRSFSQSSEIDDCENISNFEDNSNDSSDNNELQVCKNLEKDNLITSIDSRVRNKHLTSDDAPEIMENPKRSNKILCSSTDKVCDVDKLSKSHLKLRKKNKLADSDLLDNSEKIKPRREDNGKSERVDRCRNLSSDEESNSASKVKTPRKRSKNSLQEKDDAHKTTPSKGSSKCIGKSKFNDGSEEVNQENEVIKEFKSRKEVKQLKSKKKKYFLSEFDQETMEDADQVESEEVACGVQGAESRDHKLTFKERGVRKKSVGANEKIVPGKRGMKSASPEPAMRTKDVTTVAEKELAHSSPSKRKQSSLKNQNMTAKGSNCKEIIKSPPRKKKSKCSLSDLDDETAKSTSLMKTGEESGLKTKEAVPSVCSKAKKNNHQKKRLISESSDESELESFKQIKRRRKGSIKVDKKSVDTLEEENKDDTSGRKDNKVTKTPIEKKFTHQDYSDSTSSRTESSTNISNAGMNGKNDICGTSEGKDEDPILSMKPLIKTKKIQLFVPEDGADSNKVSNVKELIDVLSGDVSELKNSSCDKKMDDSVGEDSLERLKIDSNKGRKEENCDLRTNTNMDLIDKSSVKSAEAGRNEEDKGSSFDESFQDVPTTILKILIKDILTDEEKATLALSKKNFSGSNIISSISCRADSPVYNKDMKKRKSTDNSDTSSNKDSKLVSSIDNSKQKNAVGGVNKDQTLGDNEFECSKSELKLTKSVVKPTSETQRSKESQLQDNRCHNENIKTSLKKTDRKDVLKKQQQCGKAGASQTIKQNSENSSSKLKSIDKELKSHDRSVKISVDRSGKTERNKDSHKVEKRNSISLQIEQIGNLSDSNEKRGATKNESRNEDLDLKLGKNKNDCSTENKGRKDSPGKRKMSESVEKDVNRKADAGKNSEFKKHHSERKEKSYVKKGTSGKEILLEENKCSRKEKSNKEQQTSRNEKLHSEKKTSRKEELYSEEKSSGKEKIQLEKRASGKEKPHSKVSGKEKLQAEEETSEKEKLHSVKRTSGNKKLHSKVSGKEKLQAEEKTSEKEKLHSVKRTSGNEKLHSKVSGKEKLQAEEETSEKEKLHSVKKSSGNEKLQTEEETSEKEKSLDQKETSDKEISPSEERTSAREKLSGGDRGKEKCLEKTLGTTIKNFTAELKDKKVRLSSKQVEEKLDISSDFVEVCLDDFNLDISTDSVLKPVSNDCSISTDDRTLNETFKNKLNQSPAKQQTYSLSSVGQTSFLDSQMKINNKTVMNVGKSYNTLNKDLNTPCTEMRNSYENLLPFDVSKNSVNPSISSPQSPGDSNKSKEGKTNVTILKKNSDAFHSMSLPNLIGANDSKSLPQNDVQTTCSFNGKEKNYVNAGAFGERTDESSIVSQRNKRSPEKIGFRMESTNIEGVTMYRYSPRLFKFNEIFLNSADCLVKNLFSTKDSELENECTDISLKNNTQGLENNNISNLTEFENFFLPFCPDMLKHSKCCNDPCSFSHEFNNKELKSTDFSEAWRHVEKLLNAQESYLIPTPVFLSIVEWIGAAGKRNKLLEAAIYLASLQLDSTSCQYLLICWSGLLDAFKAAGVTLITAAQSVLQHLVSHSPPFSVKMLQKIIEYLGLLQCDIEEVWPIVQVLKNISGFVFPVEFFESMMSNTLSKQHSNNKKIQDILSEFCDDFLNLHLKSLINIDTSIVNSFSAHLIYFRLHVYDIRLQVCLRKLLKEIENNDSNGGAQFSPAESSPDSMFPQSPEDTNETENNSTSDVPPESSSYCTVDEKLTADKSNSSDNLNELSTLHSNSKKDRNMLLSNSGVNQVQASSHEVMKLSHNRSSLDEDTVNSKLSYTQITPDYMNTSLSGGMVVNHEATRAHSTPQKSGQTPRLNIPSLMDSLIENPKLSQNPCNDKQNKAAFRPIQSSRLNNFEPFTKENREYFPNAMFQNKQPSRECNEYFDAPRRGLNDYQDSRKWMQGNRYFQRKGCDFSQSSSTLRSNASYNKDIQPMRFSHGGLSAGETRLAIESVESQHLERESTERSLLAPIIKSVGQKVGSSSSPQTSKILSLPFPRMPLSNDCDEEVSNLKETSYKMQQEGESWINLLKDQCSKGRDVTRDSGSISHSLPSSSNSPSPNNNEPSNFLLIQKFKKIDEMLSERNILEIFNVACECSENRFVMEQFSQDLIRAFKTNCDDTLFYPIMREFFQLMNEYHSNLGNKNYNLMCLFGTVATQRIMEVIKNDSWLNAYDLYSIMQYSNYSVTLNERFNTSRSAGGFSQVVMAIIVCEILVLYKMYDKAIEIIIENNLLMERDQWVLTGDEEDIVIVKQMVQFLLEPIAEVINQDPNHQCFIPFLEEIISSQKSLKNPINVMNAVEEIMAAFHDSNPDRKNKWLVEFFEYLRKYDTLDDLSILSKRILVINFIKTRHRRLEEIYSKCVTLGFYPSLNGYENYLVIQTSWTKEEMWFVLNRWFEVIAHNCNKEHRFYRQSNFSIKYRVCENVNMRERPTRLTKIDCSLNEAHCRFNTAISVCNPQITYESCDLSCGFVRLHPGRCEQLIMKKLQSSINPR